MMANYGEIDGMPVITNKKIARTLLRDTMGFKGVLTSDGAAVLKLFNYFKTARTYKEAGLLAKLGGCDTEIPVGAAFRQLPDYVREGNIDTMMQILAFSGGSAPLDEFAEAWESGSPSPRR